jgi:hypothetical protein
VLPFAWTEMSTEADRMKAVWTEEPWTNFATDASWSGDAEEATTLVSSSRRRKAVFPDRRH